MGIERGLFARPDRDILISTDFDVLRALEETFRVSFWRSRCLRDTRSYPLFEVSVPSANRSSSERGMSTREPTRLTRRKPSAIKESIVRSDSPVSETISSRLKNSFAGIVGVVMVCESSNINKILLRENCYLPEPRLLGTNADIGILAALPSCSFPPR